MALVQYGSSDDESDHEKTHSLNELSPKAPPTKAEAKSVVTDGDVSETFLSPAPPRAEGISQQAPSKDAQEATVGVFGPSRPLKTADIAALPSLEDEEIILKEHTREAQSPYSAERAAVRELTMPRVPDFDIPAADDNGEDPDPVLNKKFATFLELKKKGTHFNARLAQSDAMKNPALMDKLMAFVGLPAVDEVAEDSRANVDTKMASAGYATTLPLDIWDPSAFPAEAYRRPLRRAQEEAAKKRARAPGERVNFVSPIPPITPSQVYALEKRR